MAAWLLLFLLSGQDLVTRIADRYQQIIDYQVEVETTVKSDVGDDPPTRIRYSLAASKPHQMYSEIHVISPINRHVKLGSDGEATWAYDPKAKQYVFGRELLTELRDQHFRLFRRFETLDRLGAKMEQAGNRLLLAQDDWTEEITLDPSSGLVRKSVFRKRTPVGTVTTTTVWKRVLTGQPPSPDTFRFKPPAGSHETNALSIP